MVNSIGDIPIATVSEKDISSSVSTDEFDLISEDSNIIFVSDEASKNISFLLILTRNGHPEKIDIEKQKEEIKKISRRNVEENDIFFGGKKGYLSIDSVNFNQNASKSNIEEVDIDGKFLAWPKHFPENKPDSFFFASGSISGKSQLEGILEDIFAIDGDIDLSLSFGSLFGVGDYGSDTYGEGSPILTFSDLSIESDAFCNFFFGKPRYGQFYGEEYSGSSVTIAIELSIDGNIFAQHNISAEKLGKKGYGYDYGYDYGGFISGFGAGSYSEGTYGQ